METQLPQPAAPTGWVGNVAISTVCQYLDCGHSGRWRVKGYSGPPAAGRAAVYVRSCDAHLVKFCEQFDATVVKPSDWGDEPRG